MENNPYSVENLWQQGDPVIKGVAILLLIMSIASWTVIVLRAVGLVKLRRIAKGATAFWHVQSFNEGLKTLG